MSAAQKKTKRNSDGFDTGKSMKKKKGNKDVTPNKTARILVITAVVIAVLFLGSVFINSDYFRQNFAAVTIDGEKYSITDFNYYYQNTIIQYNNAVSGMGDFGSSMLPEMNASLKSQVYDESTGETWAEFFEQMALDQMKADNKIYMAAKQANHQLTPDERAEMEKEIENVKSMGYASGYPNFSNYLKAAYGSSMTEAAYKENVERSYLINSYVTFMRDSYMYTPEIIESYYNENKDMFDTFTYRYFLVSAAEVKEEDYPDDASYEAAKAEAIEKAGVQANEYVAKITDEQGFIDVAREYDPEAYKEDDSTQRVYKGELLGANYGDWLRAEERQSGDVTAIEMTAGYYVVMYIARDNNHYPTVNIQQILVKQETVNEADIPEDESGTAYQEAVETAKKTAEDTANTIYKEWLDGGATEEKFTELITSHSLEIDAGNSKLNENIYKNQMPEEVNSWIYDPARKPGDHEIIYVDQTGYYIVNFIGAGEQYSDILSETQKRDKDLQAWKESLTGSEPKLSWLMVLTK
jgi:hypothetical protein